MPMPNLIHPVQVTLSLLRKDEMLMDQDAREPIHGMRNDESGDQFTIPAQFKWTKKDEPNANVGGVVTTSIGYILVRSVDMDKILGAGVRPKRGDRIVSYTSKPAGGEVVQCNLFITHLDPAGHYPEHGATLYRCHFVDRDPVQ